MLYVFTHRCAAGPCADLSLALTAAERTRSRYRFTAEGGESVCLQLPRGTVLRGGDILGSEAHDRRLAVVAKPEAVLTVTASTPLALMRAAYHLGNRHVPLEITADCLRLASDPVLAQMLQQLGVQVTAETVPFEPESGAYGHAHG